MLGYHRTGYIIKDDDTTYIANLDVFTEGVVVELRVKRKYLWSKLLSRTFYRKREHSYEEFARDALYKYKLRNNLIQDSIG